MKKITILNYILSTFLFLALITNINAQENNNWYFGPNLAYNFNTSPPLELLNSNMETDGGSASVSDGASNLLFYTNGVTVWNKDHNVMPNGSDLGSGDFFGTSISQSVVIVPDPSDVNRYYIFTNHALSGVFYSVVDMSIDNGDGSFGDVTTDKNIPLLATASEKMTAIINPADNSYWLVVFTVFGADDLMQAGVFNDTFYAYKINALDGINEPETSTVGGPFSNDDAYINPGGQMKISPDGTTLALVHNLDNDPGKLFTFDFDVNTGTVSGLAGVTLPFVEEDDGFGGILGQYDILSLYGVEFSPDSSLLYFSVSEVTDDFGPLGFGAIFQTDFKNTGQQSQPVQLTTEFPLPYKALQSGQDGKIYAVNIEGFLSSIDSPNFLIEYDGFTPPVLSGIDFVYQAIFPEQVGMVELKELPQTVPTVFLGKSTATLPKKPVLMGNPAQDDIKLKFKFIQMYNIALYDAYGDIPAAINQGVPLTYDMQNRKIYKLDVRTLTPGIYRLVINDEAGQTWYNTTVKVD